MSKEIARLSQHALTHAGDSDYSRSRQSGSGLEGTWRREYLHSAVVHVGNLDTGLTEGDIVCVMSQYGEVLDVNLPKKQGSSEGAAGAAAAAAAAASRGFAFVKYDDPLSCVLAVDNLNGTTVLGRALRVDHVKDYRRPKPSSSDSGSTEYDRRRRHIIETLGNAAPELYMLDHGERRPETRKRRAGTRRSDNDIDEEDPMAEYLDRKRRREQRKERKRKEEPMQLKQK